MACGIYRRVGIRKKVYVTLTWTSRTERLCRFGISAEYRCEKLMVGILNCLMNTHAVNVGLISCKRTAMVGIHAPAFYLEGFEYSKGMASLGSRYWFGRRGSSRSCGR